MFHLQFIFCSIVTNGTANFVAPPRHKFVTGAALLQLTSSHNMIIGVT
jgi:hypothetical protein